MVAKARLILDFDGVICDSAFEAFRLMALVFREICEITDDSFDNYYEEFLLHRAKVGPAWNYYFVYHAIKDGLVQPWIYTQEAKEFEKAFFETRAHVKKEYYSEWLSLNPPYKDFVKFLKMSQTEFTILTNKNEDAVRDICDVYGLYPHQVISMLSYKNQTSKIEIINNFPEESIKFLEDSISTVKESITNRNRNTIDVRLASWGYVDDSSEVPDLNLKLEEACNWLTMI